MTGPLAQPPAGGRSPLGEQIATVREALWAEDEVFDKAEAALSAIEQWATDVAQHLHDMETALTQIMDHIEEHDWDIPITFHSYAHNKSQSLVWIHNFARAALSAAPTATHQETK